MLMEPEDRRATGSSMHAHVLGSPAPIPETLLEESWLDFIFAEVWNRPGLPMRARYIVAMASACTCAIEEDVLEGYVRGALISETLTLAELREVSLHLAVYAGWGNGGKLDRAVTRVGHALDMTRELVPSLCPEPWDPKVRNDRGHDAFSKVMNFAPVSPFTPYLEAINNFVFGEMWSRPGLDEPSRRWITIVGVCESGAEVPIRSHIHAAMASGNCTSEEMLEFVLQYGTHAGWPKASRMQSIVLEMAQKVARGLAWDG